MNIAYIPPGTLFQDIQVLNSQGNRLYTAKKRQEATAAKVATFKEPSYQQAKEVFQNI